MKVGAASFREGCSKDRFEDTFHAIINPHFSHAMARLRQGQELSLPEATQEDLNRLLKHLDGEREAAWDKYNTLRQKLQMFYQCHNCPSPSEHADETLSRLARRDDLAEIRNISAFAYGVARKMSLEIYEERKKRVSIDDLPWGGLPDRRNVELETLEKIDRERRLKCAQRCLERLPSDERALFISFQTASADGRSEERRRLAEFAELSAGALRVRIFRIRRELERCARQCLIRKHSA